MVVVWHLHSHCDDVVWGACGADRVLTSQGLTKIEHIGSADDDVELELLKTVARQRLAAGQGELDVGLDALPESG